MGVKTALVATMLSSLLMACVLPSLKRENFDSDEIDLAQYVNNKIVAKVELILPAELGVMTAGVNYDSTAIIPLAYPSGDFSNVLLPGFYAWEWKKVTPNGRYGRVAIVERSDKRGMYDIVINDLPGYQVDSIFIPIYLKDDAGNDVRLDRLSIYCAEDKEGNASMTRKTTLTFTVPASFSAGGNVKKAWPLSVTLSARSSCSPYFSLESEPARGRSGAY